MVILISLMSIKLKMFSQKLNLTYKNNIRTSTGLV